MQPEARILQNTPTAVTGVHPVPEAVGTHMANVT